MKTKSPPVQIYHHYHYSAGFNPMKYVIIGTVILSAICGFCDPSYSTNHISHVAHRGAVAQPSHFLFFSHCTTVWSTCWSFCWSAYWHLLNLGANFFGWKGYGFFWSCHPSLAAAIFLGLPIIGSIGCFLLVKFLLKRPHWMRPIILLLYAWHCGLSTLFHTGVQWTVLLSCILIVTSLFFGISFFDFLRKKIIDWVNHCSSHINYQWKFLTSFMFKCSL